MIRLLGTLSVFAAAAAAQSDWQACEAPPELNRFYRQEIRGNPQAVENARRKLAEMPDSVFLNRWYLEALTMPDPGAPVEEYRRKLAEHPDDARYFYFYGRALVGSNTAGAIEYLDRAVARDADAPSAYWALIEIYSSANFHDAVKLGAALLRYTKLCPDDLAAAYRISAVEDLATVRELAARLRAALERRNTSGVPAYYPRLWAAEVRVSGRDEVRKHVPADLVRMQELNPENYQAQLEGYKLLGDTARAREMEQKLKPAPRRQNVYQVIDGWLQAHPHPGGGATAEQRDRFAGEELAASAEWVRDWPEEPHAWYWRFAIVARSPNSSNAEVEKTGERLIDVAHQHPARWSQDPEVLEVAREWNRRGIRLAECIQLAAEAVPQILRVPATQSDLYSNPSLDSRQQATSLGFLFDAYETEVDAALKLKDYGKAGAAIAEMKSWMDRNATPNPRPVQSLNLAKARLADAQGHTMDALAFYQRSIQAGNLAPEAIERAKKLWAQQGGSTDALEAWLTRTPDPQLWADWYEPASKWLRIDRPLDSLHATDLGGRVWTATDLQGKTTFVAAWATWCVPCISELEGVEKLYRMTKDRGDIQVVTVNIDADQSLVAPFVAQHSFTFPVVRDAAVMKTMMPKTSLPHSWIVDPAAHARRESSGFDPRAVNWADDMFARLQAGIGDR